MANNFALVRYVEDGILYVCNNELIKCIKRKTMVKYSDNHWFDATIIAKGKEKDMLQMQSQLEQSTVCITKLTQHTDQEKVKAENVPPDMTEEYVSPEAGITEEYVPPEAGMTVEYVPSEAGMTDALSECYSEPCEDSSDDFIVSDDELLMSSTASENTSGERIKLNITKTPSPRPSSSPSTPPPAAATNATDLETSIQPALAFTSTDSVMCTPPRKVMKLASDSDVSSYHSFSPSVRSLSSPSVRSESPGMTPIGLPSSVDVAGIIKLRHESDVSLTANTVLHKKTYNCNAIDQANFKSTLAFVDIELPRPDHVCNVPAKKGYVYAVINRKPNAESIDLTVAFCIPEGVLLRGNEIRVESGYITPLKLMEDERMPVQIKSKLHCCCYCSKMRAEISTHILTQHKAHPEVAEILLMAPNTPQRNSRLKELRLRGDANYNQVVPLNSRIPIRKMKSSRLRDGIVCLHCKGMVSSKNFARHERLCGKREPNYSAVATAARRADSRSHPVVADSMSARLMNELMDSVKDDDVGHVVRSDFCLRQLSILYSFKFRGNDSALINARQSLRRMARLLIEIRNVDPRIIDYEDLFLSENYESLFKGICMLCIIDESTATFRKPALAQVLRSGITALINSLMDAYLKKGLKKDSDECMRVDRFLTLHNTNYSIYIGRSAGRTRLLNKMQSEQELPDPQDIRVFSTYIVTRAKEVHDDLLRNGFNLDKWNILGRTLLAQIIVFNRRRVGEVSKMRVAFFRARTALTEPQRTNLTVLQRALADRYFRMKILAKRDRVLHVLLDVTQCQYLETYLSFRFLAGVPDNNEYLFGVNSKARYLDASVVLRHYSRICGARNPASLRATYLRKQVATLAQMLSMDDNQIHQVATYMGHTDDVHRRIYRQDEELFQVTEWSKVLMMAASGDFSKYRGKTIEEIQLLAADDISAEQIEAGHRQQDNDDDDADNTLQFDPDLVEPQGVDVSGDNSININSLGLQNNMENSSLNDSSTSANEASTSLLKLPGTSSRSSYVHSESPSTSTLTPKNVVSTVRPMTKSATTDTTSTRTKILFSNDEIEVMTRRFKKELVSSSLAKLKACETVLKEHRGIFQPCRRPRDIYNWVQYNVKKKKRKI